MFGLSKMVVADFRSSGKDGSRSYLVVRRGPLQLGSMSFRLLNKSVRGCRKSNIGQYLQSSSTP